MNCFYASAERAFDPSLEGRPLIVLSNNDGCAVTRSSEAKKLGVQMGDPWFKLKHLASEKIPLELLVTGVIRLGAIPRCSNRMQTVKPCRIRCLDDPRLH
ncbi:hypothetical protein [Specibacter sp. NPDC078692]|uniref:Y-family DNA polymerase n=1 Tax=Specibacter sp. NPDC078692 TaxID=3155818 RepID=UPI003417C9E9